jgi:Zn-dependent protease with chaperone function
VSASRRQFLHGLGLMGLGGCACGLARRAPAAVLDTRVEPLIGSNYQPQDTDERGIWQSCERIEDSIRHSDRLMRSAAMQDYTAGVMERLLGRPVTDLRIYLMHDASFNAAMFPTGMMIVHTGFMVRARNEAQFAAVLGHEAGHYFRKHTLQQYRSMRRKAAAAAVLSVGAGIAAGVAGPYDASWWDVAAGINLALVLSMFQYSRDMESEADAFGIALMSKAGYRPGSASEVWRQLIDERKLSAQYRKKRYRDSSDSVVSTHPPSEERMQDLADTAEHLRNEGSEAKFDGVSEWQAVTSPLLPRMLDEQVKRNDPGASLYLIQSLARSGWTGQLHYQHGETFRMRGLPEDDDKAAAAYAAAVQLPDAPPEAWRAHGYALLKTGRTPEGREALTRYLALQPDARDAAMVRFTLAQ